VLALAGGGTFVVLRANDHAAVPPAKPIVHPRGRSGSVEIRGADPIAISTSVAGYRLTYQVEEAGTPKVLVSEEAIAMRVPFDSRVEVRRGNKLDRTEIASLGKHWTKTAAAAALNTEVPAVVAGVAPARPVTIDEAVTAGLAERREVREVLHRRCQVVRTGSRLTVEHLDARTDSSYVDSCIDASGLVLEELVVDAMGVTSRRVATEVDDQVQLDDSVFAIPAGPVLSPKEGGGITDPVDPASRPVGKSFELPDGTSGFRRVNRYQIVPIQPENFNDPVRSGFQRAATVDVFVRDRDVVIVEQGGTLQGADAFSREAAGKPVDVPRLGVGELFYGAATTELRIRRDGGHYIRLSGTVSTADLRTFAAALTEVDGTGLRSLRG